MTQIICILLLLSILILNHVSAFSNRQWLNSRLSFRSRSQLFSKSDMDEILQHQGISSKELFLMRDQLLSDQRSESEGDIFSMDQFKKKKNSTKRFSSSLERKKFLQEQVSDETAVDEREEVDVVSFGDSSKIISSLMGIDKGTS